MGKGVLIAGYYGAGNTGDEAILAGIIEALRHEGIQDITVLSRNPEATRELHNIESIYIGRRQKGLGAVYRGLRNSSLFILGGGGLLQDHTARVVPFWLSRVGLAFAAGTPVIYYAQGIGPLKTKKARKLVGCFSNKVKYITVRDEPSKLLLEELGVDRVPIEVTADPALAINIRSEGKKLLNQAGVRLLKDSIKVGISLRNWPGEEKYLPVLQKALQELRLRLPVQYIFFPFQYGCDEEVSRQVLEELGGEEDYLVMGTHSPEQVAAMLKEMDAVLAMRLHAVILSSLSCVPAFGVIYDPKVKCYMERAGLEGWSISPEQLGQANAAGQQDLVQLLTDWLMRREEISRRMEPRVEEMRRLTQRNAQLVREMLAGAKG